MAVLVLVLGAYRQDSLNHISYSSYSSRGIHFFAGQ